MRAPALDVRTKVEAGVVRLAVAGELDAASAGDFEDYLCELRAGGADVRLDLSGLDFIDVAGSRALLRARREIARHGSLKVDRHVGPAVRAPFELSGASDLLAAA